MKDYKKEREKLLLEKEQLEAKMCTLRNEIKLMDAKGKELLRKNRSRRLFKRGLMLEDFLVEPLVLSDDDVQDLLDSIFENMDVRALISLKIWEAKKRIIEEGDENA